MNKDDSQALASIERQLKEVRENLSSQYEARIKELKDLITSPESMYSKGINDAFQLLLNVNAETFCNKCFDDSANGDSGDYSIVWNECGLRELLNVDSAFQPNIDSFYFSNEKDMLTISNLEGDIMTLESEVESLIKQTFENINPIAYAVFTESGNIQIWSKITSEIADHLILEGREITPLFTQKIVKNIGIEYQYFTREIGESDWKEVTYSEFQSAKSSPQIDYKKVEVKL